MKTPCLHPNCSNTALHSTLRCGEHIAEDETLALAQEYAVASILYYRYDLSMMSDGRFDGMCAYLLNTRAYKQIPWLEKELLMAGSGYDMENFPEELHEAARKIAQGNNQ